MGWADFLKNVDWGSVANAVGTYAGKAAQGRAQGRQAEAGLTLQQNHNQNQLFGTQQNAALQAAQGQDRALLDRAQLDLLRRKFALDAPGEYASQAARGDLLANVQDVSVDHPRAHVVHFLGGARPSALGPNARAAGALLSQQGLAGLQNPTSFDALPAPNFGSAVLRPPTQTAMPQAGPLDTWLASVGGISGLLAALAQKRPSRYPDPTGGGSPNYGPDTEG